MEYTTERGVTVNVMPIPLLLDEIRKATPTPAQPTYTETLAGGAKQEVKISDAEALVWQEKDPETWKEHAEKWATFEQERDAAQSLLNERIWKAVMKRAIVVDLPKDDDWIAEQAELGITVPENPRERRIHYIRTEVVGGLKDSIKMTAIANGADITEEALSLMESSFRNNLAREILEGLTDKARALADRLTGSTDEGGEGMAPETE